DGAHCNGDRIYVADDKLIETATALSAKPNMDPKFWAADVPAFKRAFRSSLAYRLALVAQGNFDAMLTFRPTWEWDVAAGSLLVTEAGGTVTDQCGATPLFNNAHPQINGMVAAGGVHHRFIDALV
ncbi:3'(2'),5'-bisphosphate nucleotidase CysQ, partial [Octadecabacter sp.]|nr:3'(2'),5'-bisphosphate nucleotidase CysQ [Octadecabacter sp.]